MRNRPTAAPQAGKSPLADPYAIAYLRNGAGETIRTVVFSLLTRGALAPDSKNPRRRPGTGTPGMRPLEKDVLEKFETPRSVEGVQWDGAWVLRATAGYDPSLREARKVVRSLPWLENIATLVDPPASVMDEASWLSAIVEGADACLLLDLHNLYANALTFGRDPLAMLDDWPLHRVRCVHAPGRRWLDGHLHDTPPEVPGVLTQFAARYPGRYRAQRARRRKQWRCCWPGCMAANWRPSRSCGIPLRLRERTAARRKTPCACWTRMAKDCGSPSRASPTSGKVAPLTRVAGPAGCGTRRRRRVEQCHGNGSCGGGGLRIVVHLRGDGRAVV